MHKGLLFSTTLPTGISCLFDDSHSYRCEVTYYNICVNTLHSLNIHNCANYIWVKLGGGNLRKIQTSLNTNGLTSKHPMITPATTSSYGRTWNSFSFLGKGSQVLWAIMARMLVSRKQVFAWDRYIEILTLMYVCVSYTKDTTLLSAYSLQTAVLKDPYRVQRVWW